MRLNHRFIPVNYAKIFRTAALQNFLPHLAQLKQHDSTEIRHQNIPGIIFVIPC